MATASASVILMQRELITPELIDKHEKLYLPESVIENWKRQIYIICHAIDTSGTIMR